MSSDEKQMVYPTFETIMEVRPDDIDMFQHVHSSRYMDYVLAARSDQMKRCYGMSMEAFLEQGMGWYLVSTEMHYRRSLGYGEKFSVKTRVIESGKNSVKVGFEIDRLSNGKRCFDGWGLYTIIDLKTGRAMKEIPEHVRRLYEVKVEA